MAACRRVIGSKNSPLFNLWLSGVHLDTSLCMVLHRYVYGAASANLSTVARRDFSQQPGSLRTDLPLSPAVRHIVDSHNIDITLIQPSGPKNRILKGDVLRFLKDMPLLDRGQTESTTTSSPVTPTSHVKPPTSHMTSEPSYTDIELTSMRRTIARRLCESKSSIPYSYAVIDCKMDALADLRTEIMKEKEVKLSMNDLLVKAAALTLERVPRCNASWINDSIQVHSHIDVSVAVATDGGLITPIIPATNNKSVVEISAAIRDLAERARIGKLKPQEYQGGTFCLSNLGMYGITEFTAIINPPQSAILAVGGIKTQPIFVNSLSQDSTGSSLGMAKTVSVTLSCDTRVIDYELACRWLAEYKNILEYPIVHRFL